jgi:hypothetical protein
VPYTWMAFSTETAPDIKGKTPKEIRQFIKDLVGDKLREVYFDVGKETGYALFKDLGGSAEHKQMSHKLGATGTTKMLDADQAEEALYGGDTAA